MLRKHMICLAKQLVLDIWKKKEYVYHGWIHNTKRNVVAEWLLLWTGLKVSNIFIIFWRLIPTVYSWPRWPIWPASQVFTSLNGWGWSCRIRQTWRSNYLVSAAVIEVLNVGFKVYFSQAFGAPAPSSGVSVQLNAKSKTKNNKQTWKVKVSSLSLADIGGYPPLLLPKKSADI